MKKTSLLYEGHYLDFRKAPSEYFLNSEKFVHRAVKVNGEIAGLYYPKVKSPKFFYLWLEDHWVKVKISAERDIDLPWTWKSYKVNLEARHIEFYTKIPAISPELLHKRFDLIRNTIFEKFDLSPNFSFEFDGWSFIIFQDELKTEVGRILDFDELLVLFPQLGEIS
jgi:hypothetical protein